LQHAGNDHAAACGHAKGLAQFGRQVVGLHANPAARDLAVFHNAFKHLSGGGYRNGKSNA